MHSCMDQCPFILYTVLKTDCLSVKLGHVFLTCETEFVLF